MRIAVGSDHRGVEALNTLRPWLLQKGHEVRVVGECTSDSCDYPENAYQVASSVSRGEADMGILFCGTGIGMSMAANKVPGIRAALVSDELTAQLSRSHNDANVLCLAGDLAGQSQVTRIVEKWLATPFEGGRHARRVAKIMAIERGEDPSTVNVEAGAT